MIHRFIPIIAVALIGIGTAAIYWPAAPIVVGVILLADIWMEDRQK